jgi:3-deoxy-7-phosphoheptulonate synthase
VLPVRIIAAIPVLNELTHLPVILDPSHATGRRSLAPAGVAIGSEGLIVQEYPRPEKAVSDGAQSLTFEGFRAMMRDLAPHVELWKEARAAEAVAAA